MCGVSHRSPLFIIRTTSFCSTRLRICVCGAQTTRATGCFLRCIRMDNLAGNDCFKTDPRVIPETHTLWDIRPLAPCRKEHTLRTRTGASLHRATGSSYLAFDVPPDTFRTALELNSGTFAFQCERQFRIKRWSSRAQIRTVCLAQLWLPARCQINCIRDGLAPFPLRL